MGRKKDRIRRKEAGLKPRNYSSTTSQSYFKTTLKYRKNMHIGRPLLRHHENRTQNKSKLALELGLPLGTVFIFRHSLKDRPDLVGRETIHVKFGTVAVIDKKDLSVVLIVRCMPFDGMQPQLRDQFNNSLSTTFLHARARNQCLIHSSIRGDGNDGHVSGWMGCCGWRGGCQKGKSYGPYSLNAFTSAKVGRIKTDIERMKTFHIIRDFWACRFSTLSFRIFQTNIELAKNARVPGFDETTWQKTPNGLVFASNLIVTCDGFCNRPHTDQDHTRYAMGMFGLIERKTGMPYDREQDPKLGDSQGSTFRVDAFGIEVNFDACNGIHEIIWDTKVPHQTTASTSYDQHGEEISCEECEITRYGSSCQISESLVNRIRLLGEKEELMSEKEWQDYCESRINSYENESSSKLTKALENEA